MKSELRNKHFKSEKLNYRRFEREDAESAFSFLSDKDNMKYTLSGAYTYEEVEEFIEFAISEWDNDDGTSYQFAITNEKGELIGTATLDDTTQGEGEVGWILSPKYHGYGYGTEIARFLLHFGFSYLNLRRIVSHCEAENIASYRVMEKSGMRREGLFLEARPTNSENGKEWCDELSYALLKREWIEKSQER